MEDRKNRFILVDDTFSDIDSPSEDQEKIAEEVKTDSSTDFIDSFKMDIPDTEAVSSNVDVPLDLPDQVMEEEVSDFQEVVSNEDNFTIDIPQQVESKSQNISNFVNPVQEEESVNSDDKEEVLENDSTILNDISENVSKSFEENQNLQSMINKILKIDELEPVKIEIDDTSFEEKEKERIIQEQIELEKKVNENFQKEITEVMKKDTSEVVFKSNLLEQLRKNAVDNNQVSMLARYGEDYCSKDFITNPAIGRDNEIKQLILTLLTPEKSAILIGKPGIGKTSIVEGLAYRLERNLVPEALRGFSIINIKTPSLLGTLPTGETRIQTLVDELKELDKVILFIDEIHMLIGATNESSMDFANIFKEGLGRGQIKIIGATTTEEYERYILRDKAFVRRFQSIEVLEPTREHTIKILMGTLPKIEKETGSKMKYTSFIQSEIMAFITDITSEYKRIYGIGSRYPDICLNLLKEAFSQCIFDNRNEVNIFDVRNAILNSKNIYPDVIRKEIVNFDEKFKKIIAEENL